MLMTYKYIDLKGITVNGEMIVKIAGILASREWKTSQNSKKENRGVAGIRVSYLNRY
jgi:hypothetical protein